MSFRFGLPSTDGRLHREEELTAARLAAAAANSNSHSSSHRNAAASARHGGNLHVDSGATTSASPSVAPTPGPPPPAALLPPEGAARAATTDKNSDSPPSGTARAAVPPRRHVVFPDPVAFRYLEEDPAVMVVERRAVLRGYELYLVEHWACSRRSPTLVIVTYTGDQKHSVVVGVMAIPADEREWSPRLRIYFKAIQQYHARPKDTHLGELMVTNLSSFPSALTVIPVPDGDIRKHRQMFIVNEDLKRLGCSGRSGMTLSDPTAATQAKFLQLYKTSERIPFAQAVLELVKLCQAALLVFGKLEPEFVDGLLCDVTEAAVNNWWTEIGSENFNMEPSDGILGPTTVAALLGTLMGARNRLGWYGAPVSKDVFDIDSTKRGIGYFQKAYKLEKTRRLDRQTLLKLHSVTAKAAAGEGGWGVQKAVKSTVAEIGGKRGEMVIGMVGGKDKGNIGDIETLDIDRLIGLAYGERAKWLWHGKTKRSAGASSSSAEYQDRQLSDMGNMLMFGREDAGQGSGGGGSGTGAQQPGGKDNAGANRRVQTMPLGALSLGLGAAGLGSNDEFAPQLELRTKEESATMASTQSAPTPGPHSAPLLSTGAAGAALLLSGGAATASADGPSEKDALRKTVFKRVGGKVNDARSGISGRIRDAVSGGGRRGQHGSRPSRDDGEYSIASLAQSATSLSSPVGVGRAFTWKNKPEEYANAFRSSGLSHVGGPVGAAAAAPLPPTASSAGQSAASSSAGPSKRTSAVEPSSVHPPSSEGAFVNGVVSSSVPASIAGESADLHAQMLAAFGRSDDASAPAPVPWLQRRHSLSGPLGCCAGGGDQGSPEQKPTPGPEPADEEARFPRRLSFSVAQEAVLRWEEIMDMFDTEADPLEDEMDGLAGGRLGDVDSRSRSSIARRIAPDLGSAEAARALFAHVAGLRATLGPWVTRRVGSVEALDDELSRQQEELQGLYYQLQDAYEAVRRQSAELISDERSRAAEAVRDVEVLSQRLEYETTALASKVRDVEDGVDEFERQVDAVEARADELKVQLETESWVHWAVRTLTGIGTGPNITRNSGLLSQQRQGQGPREKDPAAVSSAR